MYVSSGAGVRSLVGGQSHATQSLLCMTAGPKRENQERRQEGRSRHCPNRRRQRRGRHNHRQTGWYVLLRFSICCIWADFGGMFSVPTITVNRPLKGPELVPEWGLMGLRRDPARRSKSKMLGRFRAVGAIEFGLDPMVHTGSERNMRRYIRAFPSPFSISSILYYPPIHPHHIIFRFPHLSHRFPWITTFLRRHISRLASFLYLFRITSQMQ